MMTYSDIHSDYLNDADIEAYQPASLSQQGALQNDDQRAPLRESLASCGQYGERQLAGRAFSMACVALEITQRCNLDCTLCYLSDLAEVVKDVPLFELFRRIEMIHAHYGDHTTVQITGGDPTLRSTEELVEIVKKIRAHNMRTAFFTNGIKASREMLEALCEAGLQDIALHVDTTQERKGYDSEADLNEIRLEYMERAKGLPLRVMFNTTVHDDNVQEIPALVSFFAKHADRINLASFQMQADTGRGVLRERNAEAINQARVKALIEEGAGCPLPFDMPYIGHSDCNAYSAMLVSGNARAPLYRDATLFSGLFQALYPDEGAREPWAEERFVLPRVMKHCFASPRLLWRAARYSAQQLWDLKSGLLRGKGMHRLSFFIHNFMDETKLDKERCEACVFMVATADGPLSMCVHNAKRDAMITKKVNAKKGQKSWDPLEGTDYAYMNAPAEALPLKKSKGRGRKQLMQARQQQKHAQKESEPA